MSPKERKLMREWTAEDEIKLFDLICDFKPAGTNKHKHMVSIIENINRDLSNKEKLFTADQIWDKLESLYNLDRINNMEDSIDTKQAESESKTTDIPSSPPDEKKGPTEDTYSSELSDVEGELPSERDLVITKVESNQEDSSKNIDIRSSPVKKLRTRKSARDSNSSSTNIIDKIKNETNDTVNSSDGDTDDGTPRRITRGTRKEEQKEEVAEDEKKLKEKSKDEQENGIEEPGAKEDEITEEESKPKKTAETKTKKEPDAKSKKDPDTKTKKDTDTNSKAEKQDDEIVINEEKVIDEEKEKNDGEAIDIEDNDDERDEKEKETAKDKSNEDESESEDEDGKEQEQSRPKKRTRSIAKLDSKEDSKSSPPATNSPNSSVTPGKRRRAASPAAASSTNAQTNNSSNSTPSTRRRTRSEVAHEQKEVEETGTGGEEVEEPDSESRPRATRRSTRSAASITPAKPSPAPIRRSNRKK